MAHTKREEKYDELIFPLVRKVIKICKEYDIPMIASFQLNDDRKGNTDVDEDGDELGPFYCTTRLLAGGDVGDKLFNAGAALAPEPPHFWEAQIVHRDGKVEVVAASYMKDD